MTKSYLIIEDDLDFRTVLSDSLQKLGNDTKAVGSLDEAYSFLREYKFDRVILDLRLNKENGLDFIKTINNYENLKVLVLSGYASIETVRVALTGGAINFLQKPASISEVLNAFEGELESSNNLKQMTLEDLEIDHINKVLSENNWNISKAAKLLGLHRRSLQRKIEKKISRS